MNIIVAFILGAFALIGWFNHLRNQRFETAVRAKSERFNKLIDSFNSEKELLQFLKSEHGPTILSILSSTSKTTKIPILIASGSGIVMLFLGFGAWFLTLKVEDDLVFGATFMSALGVGLILAAAFSYVMARRWGLFEEDHNQNFYRLLNSESIPQD